MIEKFPTKPTKEALNYVGTAPLPTLREREIDLQNLPAPIASAIHWLNTSQGPFDFIETTADTTNVLLENPDASVFLAVRVVHEDNSIDGLAADTDSRVARFYSNQLPNESLMEVALLSGGRESADVLLPRLEAIKEFSLNRSFLSVYSQPNPSGEALRVWSELESVGKAKQRLMPNGENRFILL